MNDIQIVTVDATIEHGMHVKKCAAIRTKTCRDEQDLERYIVKGYLIF